MVLVAAVALVASIVSSTSSELCGALTSLVQSLRRFVVRSDPSAANLALSDFCIRREQTMWAAYRSAIAANPSSYPEA